jgi:hemerythrin-like domain-containing protein
MPLQIGQRPDHGFDEPLGLLSDCHRRIEGFLGILTAATDRIEGRALDAVARGQLEGALAYFASAAPRHTADEEESLFPRLERSGDPRAIAALDAIHRLEDDHVEAGEHHAVIDRLIRRWLTDDVLPANAVSELKERLTSLNRLYEAHIAVEDNDVFPAAARILPAAEIQAIGREMAARRSRGR